MNSNWTLFVSLCRVIGGEDRNALALALNDKILPQLVELARTQELLPALATRVNRHPEIKQALGEPERLLLQQALQYNTQRNMQTVMQALKLARVLNDAGITPIFLKGTAQLLTFNEKRLGFRKQLDIDLVVSPTELEDSCKALLNAGYGFCRQANNKNNEPVVFHDIQRALQESSAHHHVTPMVFDGYANCVEVHRHFLARQFQGKIPLEALIDTACQHESHGATFQVPSAEYQIVHIVLGKMVRDGHLAQRSFPIREGCDYIDLLENTEGGIDQELVAHHCGKDYAIFAQLVKVLMAYNVDESMDNSHDIRRRLHLMQLRYNSAAMATLLNTQARAIHLGNEMLHSPTKLPAYLKRLGRR